MCERQQVDDRELIEQFKSGSEAAFDELINRHSAKMYQVSFGLLGNRQDAEEVVQDAFVRAYRNLDKFRGDASFSTWIYRIVTNLSRNKYQWNRRRGAEVNVSISERPGRLVDDGKKSEIDIPDDRMKPDLMIQSMEGEDRIMIAMNKLPDKLREVMILRHIEDLPYESIANILETKLGTIKSRLARAREMLKEMIAA